MPPSKKNQAAVNDALEGVKLEKQGKSAPAVEAAPAVVPPAPAPIVEAAPPVVKPKRYRVKARTTVSFYGQLIILNADDVISAESYGDDGMLRLLDAVPTEELP